MRTIDQVYIVDDDSAVRSALGLLLETVGFRVRSFPEPALFLNQVDKLIPGCLILDIRMPQISGLKLQEQLVSSGFGWPIIIISGHGDIEACRKAFKMGAIDFLSKPIDEQDLIDAVQKAHLLMETTQDIAAEKEEAKGLIDQLTSREKEVLELVSRGFASKEIAENMSISLRTVESHRANIISKLGTGSVVEMVKILEDSKQHP